MPQLIFALITYTIALIGQIWFIIYLTKLDILEKNIYSKATLPIQEACLIDIGLVTLFALQHSLMARKSFKEKIKKLIPSKLERALYVLSSGIVFVFICLYYQPIDTIIWDIQNPTLATFIWALFIFGWSFSLVATFIIDHFELFGIKQTLKKYQEKSEFQEKSLYKYVRHPIQLGVLIGLWATPTMTMGHLLLSLLFTMYIFIGLYFEERDLVKEFGETYKKYQQRVGMLIPKFKS